MNLDVVPPQDPQTQSYQDKMKDYKIDCGIFCEEKP